MNVNWRADARADLRRIIAYIRSENSAAARQIGRELLIAADSLAIFPNRGRPGRISGTREFLTVRPYIIIYKVFEDRVDIVNIWHAAQDKP